LSKCCSSDFAGVDYMCWPPLCHIVFLDYYIVNINMNMTLSDVCMFVTTCKNLRGCMKCLRVIIYEDLGLGLFFQGHSVNAQQ
jgi:hypothetical protein